MKGSLGSFRLFFVCAEISSLRPCKILRGKFKAHDPVYRNLDVRQQMLGVLPLKRGVLVGFWKQKYLLECWWMFFCLFQVWTVPCICALEGTNWCFAERETISTYIAMSNYSPFCLEENQDVWASQVELHLDLYAYAFYVKIIHAVQVQGRTSCIGTLEPVLTPCTCCLTNGLLVVKCVGLLSHESLMKRIITAGLNKDQPGTFTTNYPPQNLQESPTSR